MPRSSCLESQVGSAWSLVGQRPEPDTYRCIGPTRNLLGPGGASFPTRCSICWALHRRFWSGAGGGASSCFQAADLSFLRSRIILLAIAVLGLAAGCSALPTAATGPAQRVWRHHRRFAPQPIAGLVATVVPVRSGAVAGLLLFSGGLAAFTCSLGLSGRWASEFWQPEAAARRPAAPASGFHTSFQLPTLFRRRRQNVVRERAPIEPVLPPGPHDWAPDPDPVPSRPPRQAGMVRDALGQAANAISDGPAPDRSSKMMKPPIAERFAPASAQVARVRRAPQVPVCLGFRSVGASLLRSASRASNC